jgi:hypothetical protein
MDGQAKAGHLHKCPVGICNVQVPKHMAFCRKHWFMVPLEMRQAISRQYTHAAGSRDHLEAIVTAARAVEGQLRPALQQAEEDLAAIKRRQRVLSKVED